MKAIAIGFTGQAATLVAETLGSHGFTVTMTDEPPVSHEGPLHLVVASATTPPARLAPLLEGRRHGNDGPFTIVEVADGGRGAPAPELLADAVLAPSWGRGVLGTLAAAAARRVGALAAQRQTEEERANLHGRIEHAQRLESLGVLAGGIAHDFNNLLTGVLGNADLALRDLSPYAPARPLVDAIKTAAVRASELTKQLLAYSGKGRFVVQPIDLNMLIEEMAHLLQVSISKKAVLKVNFADNLPSIDADVSQVRQVVMNLITNASEAIGERSGVISISTGVVDAGHRYLAESFCDANLADGYYVFLEVSDTGVGMDEATRERIFDPFFTTKFTGRGLGLAAVLGIVRGHRGAIRVYSEPRKGTTFKVLFPVSQSSPAARLEERAEIDDWRSSAVVLVVDDEESVRGVMKMMLESAGMTVLTASDGREALAIFRERAADIDAVVLDMTMPRMGGADTFREMRLVRPDVRVVLSSGYNEQDATNHFAGKGLAGFVQKPFARGALLERVRDAVGGAR
jgi:signal transduction histidine kinase/CheY-like chemotaxis protein